jgi:hypothetical protein
VTRQGFAIGTAIFIVTIETAPLPASDPIDRLLSGGHEFTICYCGRRLYGGVCRTCGYDTPATRERRRRDTLEADARRAREARALTRGVHARQRQSAAAARRAALTARVPK